MEDLVRQVRAGNFQGKRPINVRDGQNSGRGLTALGRVIAEIREKLDMSVTPFANAFNCSPTHLRNVSFGDRPISPEMIEAGIDLIETSKLKGKKNLLKRFTEEAYANVWNVEVRTRGSAACAEAMLKLKQAMIEEGDSFGEDLLDWLATRNL